MTKAKAIAPQAKGKPEAGRAAAAAGFSLFGLRPTPLTATIGVASIAAAANMAAAIAAPDAAPAPQTRLGASIEQSVQDRNQALANQRRALELREQATLAAEQRLKADLSSRLGPDGQPLPPGRKPGAGGKDDSEPSQYDDLARIYQTMKPQRAAPVFERLDLDVQTEVARRMRERSTALIMSSMSPAAAVRLSMALAGRPVATVQPAAVAPAASPALQPEAAPAPRPAAVTPARATPRARAAGRLAARSAVPAAATPAPVPAAPAQGGAAEEVKPVPPKVG